MQGAKVQSLIEKLRSYMLHSVAKKIKNLKPREVQFPVQDHRAGLNEVLDLDIWLRPGAHSTVSAKKSMQSSFSVLASSWVCFSIHEMGAWGLKQVWSLNLLR